MASNQNMTFDTNQVQCGLGTLSCTVPATINNVAVSATPITVKCQVTVPTALATGAGSGTAVDQGLGALGGAQGIGQGSNLSLGNGGKGLGFGGTPGQAYNTNGNGHGAGAGGQAGYGFGPAVGVQPPANVIVPSSGPAESSSLVVIVKQNGTTVFTAPAFTPTQGAMQFKTSFPATAADVITIVLSSSNANDETLNAIQANVSVGAGE